MIDNPIEFSALLTSLKQSVIKSTILLKELLKSDKNKIDISDDNSKHIVALLMYDQLVNEVTGYSYIDDFDFTKSGVISLTNNNKDKVKDNLDFMLNYMNYRIKNPIDLAEC